MNDLDLLQLVIDKLGNVAVPISMDDTISKPVKESRDLLIMLRKAIINDLEKKRQNETKNGPEPELKLEVVKDGESGNDSGAEELQEGSGDLPETEDGYDPA